MKILPLCIWAVGHSLVWIGTYLEGERMAHACFSSSVHYTSHSCVLRAFLHAIIFPNLGKSKQFILDLSFHYVAPDSAFCHT